MLNLNQNGEVKTLLNLDSKQHQMQPFSPLRNQLSESNNFYKSALLQHQQQAHGYSTQNLFYQQQQQHQHPRFIHQQQPQQPQQTTQSHSKSYSLPVEFQGSQNVFFSGQLPPPATRITHINGDIPLPPGWECERTSSGQAYFLNHLTKSTSWEDPRKLYNLPSNQVDISNDTRAIINQIPLPDGWEQAITSNGEIYFINHISKTTSWEDPRISIYMQQQFNSSHQAQPHQRSSSASSLCSTSSFSSSSSILFDSTKAHINSAQKEHIKTNLESLAAQKAIVLKQIDELTKQEMGIKSKLTPNELEDVLRVVQNQPELQNNKENVYESHANDEMDTTLITDNALL
jgi:hypothetical protein